MRKMSSSSTWSGSWHATKDGRAGRGKHAASSSAALGDPDHVSRAREDRLLRAGERLEAERDAQVAANRAYEDYRGRVGTGKAAGSVADRKRGSRRSCLRGW